MRRANVVLGLITSLLVTSGTSRAQAAPKPQFEVASVRASAPQSAGDHIPPNGDINGGPGTSDPARWTFFRVPLNRILMAAFDVPANRLKAPEWTGNVEIPEGNGISSVELTDSRYDIAATMPPGTTKAQAREMLRNLLIDRFKLTYHLEKKNFDGYAATAAKGGVKLRPSDAANESEATPLPMKFPLGPDGFADLPARQAAIAAVIVDDSRRVRWSVRMISIASLLELLKQFYPLAARLGDRNTSLGYIVDETGLTGIYDCKFEYPLSAFQFGNALEYASGAFNFADRPIDVSWKNIVRFQAATVIRPDIAALAREAVAAAAGSEQESDPALFAAIEKQLGIRLVKSKIPLDVVTVDHIEKIPSGN